MNKKNKKKLILLTIFILLSTLLINIYFDKIFKEKKVLSFYEKINQTDTNLINNN